MSYKVKSDKSAELMYIADTGEYKIIVDVGDTIYVFDTPGGSTLSQLTDYQMVEGENEKKVRTKLGIYVTDNKTFNSGFYKNDRLVSVPINVNQITPAIADDANDVLKGFFDGQKNMIEIYGASNDLWTDPEYLAEIASLTAQNDGDVDAAVEMFEGTPAYGDILKRLEVSETELKAQQLLRSDPLGFGNIRDGNILNLEGAVQASGGSIPTEAVHYLADLVTKGIMTLDGAKRNIIGATDKYSTYADKLDAGFVGVLEGKDVTLTKTGEEDVQTLLDTYLPSYLHGTIDISKEAGNIRANPDYEDTLVASLKKARFADYNMYDEDVNWNVILAGKKQLYKNIMGSEPKEGDPALDAIIRMNDTGKATSYLREIGLEQGNQTVMADRDKAAMAAFGDGTIRSQAYVENR